MKTIITSVLLLITSLTYSQSNYQIADSTKEWNTVNTGLNPGSIIECRGTTTNFFGGDTLVNGFNYLIVLETNDTSQSEPVNVGLLREDTATKQVFFKMGEDEGLIYDFNINVGDTIYIDNYYIGSPNIRLCCDSTDTVNIDGYNKRRFYFNYFPSQGLYDEIWTENIGSNHGLLFNGYLAAGLSGGGHLLSCCSKNDTLIYFDSTFQSCYVEEFYPKILSEYFDTAFVGIDYEFQLLVDTNNVDSFAIEGIVIPEDFSFNESTYKLIGKPTSIGSLKCVIYAKNLDLNFNVDMIGDSIRVVLPTNNNEILNTSGILIYPNPFRNTIIIENKKQALLTLEIYNSNGLLLEKKIIESKISKHDFGNYKNGLYLFKISDKNQKILRIEKLIKK